MDGHWRLHNLLGRGEHLFSEQFTDPNVALGVFQFLLSVNKKQWRSQEFSTDGASRRSIFSCYPHNSLLS